jgi:hypothetical protein
LTTIHRLAIVAATLIALIWAGGTLAFWHDGASLGEAAVSAAAAVGAALVLAAAIIAAVFWALRDSR